MSTPLIIGQVEVVEIHPGERKMRLVVHHACPVGEFYSPQNQKEITQKVRRTFNYLCNEGFIDAVEVQGFNWTFKYGVVLDNYATKRK